ncbi:MAG: ABC-type transport auxiliary lipoprotein family protein [Campylobacterota bacterium]|nr:ABC-type transport auxiliary lipoprotein family protein [Campylobacterota bacterium]
MNRTIGEAVVVAGLILLGGCSTKSDPMQTYNINPNLKFSKLPHSIYREKSVKVAYPINIKGRSGTSIYYAYNRLEDGVYQDSSWSSNSSQLLTSSIMLALEHGRVFKSVVDYTSLANTDYLLESEVYDFYHKLRKDLSLSVVSIRFDLISTDNNILIKSKKFSYEIPTETVNAVGYVKATNIALERLSADLSRWLGRS